MPTYKRNISDNGYTNKKEQPPSYTDRVLFKNNTDCSVIYREYDCHDEVFGSDHRPVFLRMAIKLRPNNLLNPNTFLVPDRRLQGFGKLEVQSLKLKLKDIEVV